MLIWLVLIPLIAAALIGLCKAPARPTALLSASLTLALGIWALVSFDGCSSCWSRFEGMDLQLTLAPALSKVMLLLTILVTFATVLGTNPPQGGEASWYNSALLISAGATGAFLSDNIISFFAFHELALIPTFVMIGLYGRGDRRTTAWRATLYLGLASMVLLAALLMIGTQAGFTFSGLKDFMASGRELAHAELIGALLIAGFGTLISLFPFHSWAAPAYASAPAPVAMMHAGVLKKFGLYGLFMFQPLMETGFLPWIEYPAGPARLQCHLGGVRDRQPEKAGPAAGQLFRDAHGLYLPGFRRPGSFRFRGSQSLGAERGCSADAGPWPDNRPSLSALRAD